MLEINMADVLAVLELIRPYLIAVATVLVIAIIIFFAVSKLSRPKKFIVRSQTGIITLISIVVIANLISFGPLSTMLTLASGQGKISDESGERAMKVGEDIAAEGIVLLENKDNLLPLSNDAKVNVFGWASTNPVYGGGGSGALSGTYETVSLLEGLFNAGIEYNEELEDFYIDYRADRPAVEIQTQDWTLPEPPIHNYSESLMSNALSFSNQAIVVISRSSSEETDLAHLASNIQVENNSTEYNDFENDMHYLQLTKSEQNLIDLVTSNFSDVIIVYNGANMMELGFVEDYDQIKSVIWSPGPGQTGFNSLGKILTGEINPSAKTADTFVYDLTQTPYYNNIGHFGFDNADEFAITNDFLSGQTPTFVNYVEGIYVGYRFYETADVEGLINFDEVVQYPFGHGLSYTNFSQELHPLTIDSDNNITIEVTVTNEGNTAGKEVVQLYYTPPYTNGGIEKSEVNLVAFGKTTLLNSGESETLSFTFNYEDLASYDTYNTAGYIVEKGEYVLSLRSNSHDVIESESFNIDETIVFDSKNPRSTDEIAATNQFEHVEGDIEYLSREDGFANYQDAIASPANYSMSDEVKSQFVNDTNYDVFAENNPDDKMPVTGADNGLVLADYRGVDYDDESWNELLDQLTVDEMADLIVLGGFQTQAIDSIEKVATLDVDGPASLNNNFTGVGSIGLPVALMLANTWNVDLAQEFGDIMGEMAVEMRVSGWYAPGLNMHRSAFGGRNFEYYSEDPLLSGKIGATTVSSIGNHGVYSYIKHFVLNEQETNRTMSITTWSNEQAFREIYLKPFELAIKDGGTTAVMSSFNFIGPEWAGASNSLLNTVLRDEWGFRGTVLTDYFIGLWGYMDTDIMIRNGGDLALVAFLTPGAPLDDTESATAVQAMRQASKNILYTTVNSNAYSDEFINESLPIWQIIASVINVVVAALIIWLEVLIFKKYKNLSNE